MVRLLMATIHPVHLGKTTAYVVEGNSGSVLVDAGTRGKSDRILDVLRGTAHGIEGLGAVVLTHTHSDHTGSLAEVCSRLSVDVLVHEAEAESLRRGYTPLPRGTSIVPKLIAIAAATASPGVGRYAAVAPTETVGEWYDLSRYGVGGRVVHTPGHTAGSMSIVLDAGAALVGDTLFHFLPWSVYPPFADDPDTLLQSWQLLLDSGAEVFYPAHGGPVPRARLETELRRRLSG